MTDIIPDLTETAVQQRKYTRFVMFLLVFFATKGSALSNSLLLPRILLVCLVIYFFKKKISLDIPFVKLTAGYFLYAVVHMVASGVIGSLGNFLFFYIDVILLTYLSIKYIGRDFFFLFERVVYKWTKIILPIFFIQLLSPSLVFKVNSAIGTALKLSVGGREAYSNSILYTSNNAQHIARNCGFMWEPGAFGAMLVIALIVYILREGLKMNKVVMIYLISIITTLSTTAYINLMFIPVFILTYNYTRKNKMLAVVLLAVCFVVFFLQSNNVVIDKITSQLASIDNDTNQTIINTTGNSTIALGRFSSLYYLLPLILQNFVIGIGWGAADGVSMTDSVNISNGLALYFVMFGFIGFLFLLYNINKSFRHFTKLNWKTSLVFTLILLNIGFSNPILILPLFMAFQIYGYIKFI